MNPKISSRILSLAGLCLSLGAGSGPVWAQNTAADPSALLSAKSLGRGGATVASNLNHDSLFQNPASSAFVKKYAVTGGYLGNGNSLTASIVDTLSGPLGGGLYYLRRDLRNIAPESAALGNYARSEEHAGFSLMGRPAQQIGVGLSVHYVYRKSYQDGVSSRASWNGDAGIRYSAAPGVTLGLLGQNLLNDDMGLYPRRYTAGAEYQVSNSFFVSAQAFKVDTKSLAVGFTFPDTERNIGWAAGGEFWVSQEVAARAGYTVNPTWKQTLASLGLGWDSKTISVDYSFQMNLKSSDFKSHTVTVTGYF